jgi:hypothetical protein
MYTRDTAGTGSGMPQYAKVQHHTCNTRFGNTVGISVPMTNLSWATNQKPSHEGSDLGGGELDGVK